MTEHNEDAVVERIARWNAECWRGADNWDELDADQKAPYRHDARNDLQDIVDCLKPGDRLPGGLVCVPAEPTPKMLAVTLPNLGVDVAPHTVRLAEQALFFLEPKDFAAESHRSGIDAALALITDYRNMLAAAASTD